jgi:hypothetical protein
MKKIVFFSLLIAASIWTLVYVAQKKNKYARKNPSQQLLKAKPLLRNQLLLLRA